MGLIRGRTPQNCQASGESRGHVSSGLTRKTRLIRPFTSSSSADLGERVVRGIN